eukprot:9502876-Pyramimonas_sp.AAC.1
MCFAGGNSGATPRMHETSSQRGGRGLNLGGSGAVGEGLAWAVRWARLPLPPAARPVDPVRRAAVSRSPEEAEA